MKPISKPAKKIMPSKGSKAAPLRPGKIQPAPANNFPKETANAYRKPSRVMVGGALSPKNKKKK